MPPRGHNESSAQRDTEDTRHRHCVPPPSLCPGNLERIIHRHAIVDLPIHEKSLQEREKRKIVAQTIRDSLLFIIKSEAIN